MTRVATGKGNVFPLRTWVEDTSNKALTESESKAQIAPEGRMTMDVQEIVWEHLQRVGATGLCNESCGCEAPDLMPCDDCTRTCVPAVRRKCGPDCEECGGDGGCMTPLEPVEGDPANNRNQGQTPQVENHE